MRFGTHGRRATAVAPTVRIHKSSGGEYIHDGDNTVGVGSERHPFLTYIHKSTRGGYIHDGDNTVGVGSEPTLFEIYP